MPSPRVGVRPPKQAQQYARRGLDAREAASRSKRCCTPAGITRAHSILRGEIQDAVDIRAWFRRHAGYYEAAVARAMSAGKSLREAARTERAIQAWWIWGGDPMRRAAERAARAQNPMEVPPSGFMEGSKVRGIVYHGTAYDVGTGHSLRPTGGSEFGIYLTPTFRYARQYGPNVARAFVSIRSPLYVDDKSEISPHDLTEGDVRLLQDTGHDGIIVLSPRGEVVEIVAFIPEQVWVTEVR